MDEAAKNVQNLIEERDMLEKQVEILRTLNRAQANQLKEAYERIEELVDRLDAAKGLATALAVIASGAK